MHGYGVLPVAIPLQQSTTDCSLTICLFALMLL